MWNYGCIISLVFIVLNVGDGTESKYPSIVFLSICVMPCLVCAFISTLSLFASTYGPGKIDACLSRLVILAYAMSTYTVFGSFIRIKEGIVTTRVIQQVTSLTYF